jgi:chromosome segregation ATPase
MEEAMESKEAQLTELKRVIIEKDSEIGTFQKQVPRLEELLQGNISKIKELEAGKISLVEERRNIREDKRVVDQRMLLLQQERVEERDALFKLELKSIQDTLLLNSTFKKCQDYQSFLQIEKDKLGICEVRFQLKQERK